MTDPVFIWYAIVGIVLLTFVFGFIRHIVALHEQCAVRARRREAHFIELGKERDIFFIPGDSMTDGDDDDDDDM